MYRITTCLIIICSLCFSCGTEQDVIFTGIPDVDQHIDKSMLSYLKQDKDNWELTVDAIKMCGLEDLFDGTGKYKDEEITFFGIKSWSLRVLFFNTTYTNEAGELVKCTNLQEYAKALEQQGDPDRLKRIFLQHVVMGRKEKKSFAYRDKQYMINDPRQKGYTVLTTLGANQLWAYLDQTDYMGVPNIGPVIMNVYCSNLNMLLPMATPDISVKNGIVHALNYNYLIQEVKHED